MAHSHAFSPFASSAVPGSLSFPPFSSPSIRPSSFFGVCWELFGETLREVGIPSIQSRLWLSTCSVLFRFPPSSSSGPVVAYPVFPRAFFCLFASRFSRGSVTFDTRVPSGSLPSNGFTDFEEFGPRGDGPLSASLALEMCPMCGMVTFIELTVLSSRSALTGAASPGVGGMHLLEPQTSGVPEFEGL